MITPYVTHETVLSQVEMVKTKADQAAQAALDRLAKKLTEEAAGYVKQKQAAPRPPQPSSSARKG